MAQLGFTLALTVCELRAHFFVSSQHVNMIWLFPCDDTLHQLREPLRDINNNCVLTTAESTSNINWTKVKTLHLNCLPFIYNMMQASKSNGSVSKCPKTGLCITVKVVWILTRGNSCKSFKCDRGPIIQVKNLNRNHTQFRPSEIHYPRDPTERNGSLDMWQPEMWRTYHKCVLIV